jgi:Mycothiol maleylpyruvate isomerase N-terminal domain.
MQNSHVTDTLVQILSLALRLENEGQYNIAKIARATADSISRRAAWEMNLPNDKETLASDIEKCPTCGAWGGTFQWFPPVYWLEALDPAEALERLRKTPLEVAALIEGLSEEALTRPAPDGGWAIRNVVSHLRDAQGVLDFRIDLFLKEKNPVLEMKQVWKWAKDETERPPSTREIFETYLSTRREVIAKLETIPLADWWRTGRHEEFGVVSIKQQASYFASHELTHLPQIERLVKQVK